MIRATLHGLVAVLLAVLVLPGPAAAQCVMCGTVGQGKDDPLVKGMGASIAFMVSMPFAVAGAVGGWLWRERRRQGDEVPDRSQGDEQ